MIGQYLCTDELLPENKTICFKNITDFVIDVFHPQCGHIIHSKLSQKLKMTGNPAVSVSSVTVLRSMSAAPPSPEEASGFPLFVLAERPLFLGVLHYLLLHVQPFAAADGVHVFQGLVFRVGLLAEVQVFFLGGGNPVRIAADHLGHRRRTQTGSVSSSEHKPQSCVPTSTVS